MIQWFWTIFSLGAPEWRQCVRHHKLCCSVLRKRCQWECLSSERKIKSSCFKPSEDLKNLKRNSQVSRPEFKSSRKLKRGLSFNDLIILAIDLLYGSLEYQWPLCPALRSWKDCHFGWRSKRPAWNDVRIWLCSGIRFNSRFMFL